MCDDRNGARAPNGIHARAGRTPRDGGRRRSVGRGIGVLHCCRRRFALHGTALHPARPPPMVFHRNRSSGDIIMCTRKKNGIALRGGGGRARNDDGII